MTKKPYIPYRDIVQAQHRLDGVVQPTPLQYSQRLSRLYQADIYLKREDLQPVRSYKIRGAYNKIASLHVSQRRRGIVTASAGNHAQGVALSASTLGIKADIFMPVVTPSQKVSRVQYFGDGPTSVHLVGNTYDDSSRAAKRFCAKNNAIYVHPFDDPVVIAGQATATAEVYAELMGKLDLLICPVGGGGLVSGAISYLAHEDPKVEVVGVEPAEAAAMASSLRAGELAELKDFSTFVDGAAVACVGDNTFAIAKTYQLPVETVTEGDVCTSLIELYQNEGIIAEPAGALAVTALPHLADKLRGKTVVCHISGGNNDLLRYPEILEKSLVAQGLKHYFLVEFAQKPGQFRQFLEKTLIPTADITRFEYIKKTAKERGPALVGIELANQSDYNNLLKNFDSSGAVYEEISPKDLLYKHIV